MATSMQRGPAVFIRHRNIFDHYNIRCNLQHKVAFEGFGVLDARGHGRRLAEMSA